MNGPACLGEHHHAHDANEFAEGPAQSDGHGHGSTGRHHGQALQDSTGPRLLATLALNLIIPTALINALLLATSSGVILYHATQRFLNPQAVDGAL